MELLASEMPTSNAAAKAAAASESVAPALVPDEPAAAMAALDAEPPCSVGTSSARTTHRISYAAAAAKGPVRPKPSAAGFEPRPVQATKFSTGRPASQPAVAPAPLEASMYMHYGRARQHFARCT